MIAQVVMLIFMLVFGTPEPVILKGWLSAYDYGPTVATVAYRQETGQLPRLMTKYDGVIAVSDCSLIGTDATLHTVSGEFEVIVFDCAGRLDGGAEWMASNEVVAEVGYFIRYWHPEIIHTKVKVVYHDGSDP